MKRPVFILLSLIMFNSPGSFAQEDYNGGKNSVFHLSLGPKISSNGRNAINYTNVVSLNMTVGYSMNERALAIGVLGNVINNNAAGLQLAGLANYVGHRASGVQVAGLANCVISNSYGFQLGGLANYTGGFMKGVQISGMANFTVQNTHGLQFAGMMNLTSREHAGLQLSGMLGAAAKKVSGVQISGLMGYTDRLDGVQVSGLASLDQVTRGVQLSGLVNLSETVKGVGIAGVTNITRIVRGAVIAGVGNYSYFVRGVQVAGIFNRAVDVRGVQFAGLVNIATTSDWPIGLVNIIKKGEMSAGVSYDESGSTTVNFRSGGRFTYGIVGMGYNHRTDGNGLVVEAGYGLRIKCTEWLRINNEVRGATIGGGDIITVGYYLLPAFRLFDHYEVYGGPAIKYAYADDPADKSFFPDHSLKESTSDKYLKSIYIGWQVGVQYVF